MINLNKMRVWLCASVLFFGFAFTANAQDDEYKDILFLIIDGEYEKALKQAERISSRDKTRREPVPYIYASMAYYEMSKREEFQKDYPRAFREAIKAAYKARRYDKENEHFPKHTAYINELKAEIMREAIFLYQSDEWRKSTTFAKYVTRIDPDDVSALLLTGIAEVKSRNVHQSIATFENAQKALEQFNASDVDFESRNAFLFVILEYARLMADEGTKADAQPYLDAVADIYADDAEFQSFYESY